MGHPCDRMPRTRAQEFQQKTQISAFSYHTKIIEIQDVRSLLTAYSYLFTALTANLLRGPSYICTSIPMKKYGKRFMIGWILSSILMFAVSYVWHGVVLNDFERISYPFEIYLVSAGVVYLVIGFLMSRIFIAEFLDRYSEKAVARGLLTGIGMGVIVFMSALVFGVSFSSITDPVFLLMDFVWQVVEQTVGGLSVGLIYLLVFEFIPQPMEEENNAQSK